MIVLDYINIMKRIVHLLFFLCFIASLLCQPSNQTLPPIFNTTLSALSANPFFAPSYLTEAIYDPTLNSTKYRVAMINNK